MKLGLYALAGFGAFAVYNKYIAQKEPDLETTEDPMASFNGTRWQQDTARGTSWQQGNVFSNAAGCGYSSAAGPNYDMSRYATRTANPDYPYTSGPRRSMRMSEPYEPTSGHMVFRTAGPGPGGTVYYPPMPKPTRQSMESIPEWPDGYVGMR